MTGPTPSSPGPPPDYRDPRLTEQRNPRTQGIDVASSLEIVDLINAEDATVAPAVHAVRAELARAIDLVVTAFQRGGRLIYVGAGTSGRLGVRDASECPPTFGTPPEMVVGVIAGGYPALVKSSGGAEGDVNAGMAAMDQTRVRRACSEKLRDRGERIVMECCRAGRGRARTAIQAAGGSVKLAIVMVAKGAKKAEAERLLAEAGGFVRRAVGDPPPAV